MINRFKAACLRILKTERSLGTLTASCCVGIFMAFCPFLGKTLLILGASPLLGLNAPVVLITCTFIYNPWSAVPVYLFGYWFGQWLLTGMDVAAWDPSWLSSFTQSLGLSNVNLLPLLVGCNGLGILLACAFYPLIRWGFGRYFERDSAL